MRQLGVITLISALGIVLGAPGVQAEGVKILFLSKSSGFEHEVIKDVEGKPSHAARVLQGLGPRLNAEVVSSKDASLINAENLKNYDLVIFYTTGDLTEPGNDGNPPMGENGAAELMDWIRNGGGFMGFHAATDTFRAPEDDSFTPYTEMIGAEFLKHGKKFEGTVKVVDPSHPAAASMPPERRIFDEWYLFKFPNAQSLHVLALLDPGEERQKQEVYDIPSYPIIWCSQLGKGRVYYNGLGHEFDVWSDPAFQNVIIDAARWAMGEGPAQAAPNYAHVVPKDKL